MESQKINIIKKSGELFAQYGIKSVTMDDIARKVGVSKKTLYVHFESKTDLLNNLLEDSKEQLTIRINEIEKNGSGGLEKLYRIYLELVKFSNKSSKITYWSFRKYYRDLFDEFIDYIGDLIDEICEIHLKEAQWDNFIIPNIEAKIFGRFLRKSLMELPDDLLDITNVGRADLQRDFVYYNFRSIATSTGLEQLKKIKNI